MAGHSKWANIKRRKGAQDAKRGKVFTKLVREITAAARMGGSDPDGNPRLRLAIDKARAQSMPKDNIQRAIAKGAGELDGANYEEFSMEGYGPGGVAVMIKVLTDNRNRTASEVRHAFAKNDGNLGTSGCVSYMFHHKGVFLVDAEGTDEDTVMEAALEGGAEDVTEDDGVWEVLSEPADYDSVAAQLTQEGLTLLSQELTWVPETRSDVTGRVAERVLRLVETLEDLDDVQDVFHNAEISEEELERLS